ALMYLETGRYVITGITISSKADMSELSKTEPELAKRYEELRRQYAKASKDLEKREKYREAREIQRDEQIRQIPGWQTFQLALSEDAVKYLAMEGPIVVVNATPICCDAIVITQEIISVVKLHEMTYKKLAEYLATTTISDALLRLWTVAVEPILAATPLTPSRRVWWLTTGIAGRAPFHAASDHRPGSANNASSHAISSYIPSLKALHFSRSKRSNSAQAQMMLLVTMSTNPAPHHNLDTSYEEAAITKTFGTSKTHIAHPTPEDVLSLLPNFPFVHFACHGASIAYDPSQSGLLLTQNNPPAMITISDLEVDLIEGAIAYLSACFTAEQPDGKLADEAIHLANSFQALGFQHVIGTIWGADDRAAGEVARVFYERVFERESGVGGWDVAGALHGAVKAYKDEENADVVTWGPFVHIGSS
ncbi:hypothetical protein EK21DRAFT_60895, partial [Setomelanomma holmii]